MAQIRVANIGPRERKRRLRFGIVAFGISVVAAGLLVAGGVSPRWRLALFVPFFVAGLGYFQARDKT
jgi:fatty acid desaturase